MPSPSPAGQPQPVALFVSDVHLQAERPRTTRAFLDFLESRAQRAARLYILGDLFEAWAGDDDIDDPYNRVVISALHRLHEKGVQLFWLAGNRDFLVGTEFAKATGAVLLEDPAIVTLADRRIALAHGDAQCTDDTGYIAFREQVRQPSWQQQFLAMPLTQRKALIARMRGESQEAQLGKSYEIMDVNSGAIDLLMAATGCDTLIHGHTHRPACHRHPSAAGERVRCVLPDWDCDSEFPRGGWIGAMSDGTLERYALDGSLRERC